MSVYFVNQSKTYKQERAGGYLWSPKLDSAGNRNAGYTLMTHVKCGDFILHNSGGRISAVSVVTRDCYDAVKPGGISESKFGKNWNNDGYRVDTKYYDFETPIMNTDITKWAVNNPAAKSCFDRYGKVRQAYLCNVAPCHAEYILMEALKVNESFRVREVIYRALIDALSADNYSESDKTIIDQIVADQDGNTKQYSRFADEIQDMTETDGIIRPRPKRDMQRAANALQNANYMCEYNTADTTFLRDNGKPYTEPHYLIPICRYEDFDCSLDVEENIVSLCTNCNTILQYGDYREKGRILRKLYSDRIDLLSDAGLYLPFEKLRSYY